jgi:hypothetical protein
MNARDITLNFAFPFKRKVGMGFSGLRTLPKRGYMGNYTLPPS